MKHVFQQVERGSFPCVIPSAIDLKLQTADVSLNANRKKKQKAIENETNPESNRIEKDSMIVDDWKLSENQKPRFKYFFAKKGFRIDLSIHQVANHATNLLSKGAVSKKNQTRPVTKYGQISRRLALINFRKLSFESEAWLRTKVLIQMLIA